MEKKINLALIMGLMNCLAFSQVPNAPQANISNGWIKATIVLPDPDIGFYRASRFDWSGIISDLQYKGHSFFGQWFDNYDPFVHESVMGPAEEFDPIGFVQGQKDGNFVKIGVGILMNDTNGEYSFSKTYPVEDFGVWKVEKEDTSIRFVHNLERGNFPYRYEKKVVLTKGKPEMVLEHTLVNTGGRTIDTKMYNHNFFLIDNQNIGPGYVVEFPFLIDADTSGSGSFAEIVNNGIFFKEHLGKGDHFQIRKISGFSDRVDDYQISIENRNTGAGVSITADTPISKLAFWSASKAICPEPYVDIKLLPGQSMTWRIQYKFYTF